MSHSYFNKLNYTLANEDTSLELEILPQNVGHVLSVAGSGGRVMPLLARNPKRITCVDLAKEQLYLTELRMESLRALSREEFMSFWGYPPKPATPAERKSIFGKIKLSAPAEDFLRGLFDAKNWESILYEGKWENTFAKLSRVNSRITGKKGAAFFEARTIEEHNAYLKRGFPWLRWWLVLFLLGNASVFNAILYKGKFPQKNIKLSMFAFYRSVFKRLFAQDLARRSYFLQILFFGKVLFEEGCPVECKPEVFAAAKKAVNGAEIVYRQGDIVSEVRNAPVPVDFLSLSDVPSYFSGEAERMFMRGISQNLSPGAVVVTRNYLRIPENTDFTGYDDVTGNFQQAIDGEKVGVYDIVVHRWRGTNAG
jgi:S-adenosylmethionine-diacylglycerol 3-amino-3-carboxypropyl transferase